MSQEEMAWLNSQWSSNHTHLLFSILLTLRSIQTAAAFFLASYPYHHSQIYRIILYSSQLNSNKKSFVSFFTLRFFSPLKISFLHFATLLFLSFFPFEKKMSSSSYLPRNFMSFFLIVMFYKTTFYFATEREKNV